MKEPGSAPRTPGKRHVPTEQSRNEVQAYATVHTPHHDIAVLMNISTPTLLKHYQPELTKGKARGLAHVCKTLYTMATVGENLGAICFILKCQGGWRETSVVQSQLLGADGNPVDQPKLGISWNDGGPGLPRKVLTHEPAAPLESENAREEPEPAQRH